jgi:peroxiredoxin family protein
MDGVLAAILESEDPERLYTGLSLLVSAASEGREARALVGFGALRVLLDPDLKVQPRHVVAGERDAFARTFAELRDAAFELCQVWACAAAVQANGVAWETASERLAGVISTPQFIREAAGAQLVFV